MQLLPEPRGSLANLRPSRLEGHTALRDDQILVAVRAVGINFRDVLNVLGMYPGDPGAPGGDCAGTVVAVPSGSSHRVGDAVFGQAGGCLGTHVVASAQMMVRCPAQASAEEAASLPTVFLTALASLRAAAPVGPGHSVLIHAATGGLGLAAVQVASALGATAVGTAGATSKRAVLRRSDPGVAVAVDSRSTTFASDLATMGGSVAAPSVVLNSMTSPGMVAASLAVLGRGGHFVEVAKRDIWSAARVAQERPDVAFHTVAVDFMPPSVVNSGLQNIAVMLASGRIKALPAMTFSLGDVAAAMRQLSAARHIGKVVTHAPPRCSPPSGAWIITGGTGALGVATAQHLCSLDATACVLLGRTGTATDFALKHASAAVTLASADCWPAVQILEAGRQVSGILHAGGAVVDATLRRQTASTLRTVFAPKVGGALVIEEQARLRPVQAVAAFSSIASALGSGGQANYAAANALLDATAQAMHAQGMPSTTVNWGAWAGAGMAAHAGLERMERMGFGAIAPSQGVNALGGIIASVGATLPPQLVASVFFWQRFRSGDALFSQVKAEAEPEISAQAESNAKQISAPSSSAGGPAAALSLAAVEAAVAGAVATVVGVAVPRDDPLVASGVDSLGEYLLSLSYDFIDGICITI